MMYPEYIALLWDVIQNIADDTPRSILADWCEDNGRDDEARDFRALLKREPADMAPVENVFCWIDDRFLTHPRRDGLPSQVWGLLEGFDDSNHTAWRDYHSNDAAVDAARVAVQTWCLHKLGDAHLVANAIIQERKHRTTAPPPVTPHNPPVTARGIHGGDLGVAEP